MRWAALLAFSVVLPESSTTSLSLAPPSAFTPPCALMWSTAISAPSRITVPGRAYMPETGTNSPTLISAGDCAHARDVTRPADAAASRLRRVRALFFISRIFNPPRIMALSFLRPERLRQREIRRINRHRNAVLPLHDHDAGANAAPLLVELQFAARIIFGGPAVHGAEGVCDREAISLASLLEGLLHQPHVAIGRDDVLRHPRFFIFLLQLSDEVFVALRAPIGHDGHDALHGLRRHTLQHVRFGDRDAERDGRNLALAETELVDLFKTEFGVGYGVR